jgi:hypothetical protein
MSRLSVSRWPLLVALVALVASGALLSPPGVLAAQSTPVPPLSPAEIRQLATIQFRMLALQDSMNVELAASRNKTPERQAALRDTLRLQVASLLGGAGLDQTEFQRRRSLVSTHESARRAFDEAIVDLQAAAKPAVVASAAPAAPAAAPQQELPAGPMGAHIGHVLVSFADTPDKVGLLTIAKQEAEIAAQHAGFAARTPTNLESMQRHAGHVLHAIDPSLETSGPGKGYGVKKGATGVATHIEMAAKVESAPAGVRTHAEHVATAARTTVSRAEEIVSLAQKVRAAKTAEEAAGLVAQMASLSEQLVSGVDLNADGRIMWNNGEGGLQQAEEHMKLLLAAATPAR